MFIKKVIKKFSHLDKSYDHYRLVESYRTEKGPRQRTLLDLGQLSIDPSKLKDLANRIEQIISKSDLLFPVDDEIEKLAQYYSQLIINKNLFKNEPQPQNDSSCYKTVDINNIETTHARTFGNELIAYSTYQELGIKNILTSLGFSEKECTLAAYSIIGRLIKPASENFTVQWLKNMSALPEVMKSQNIKFNRNHLYQISEKLLENKEKIESLLEKREAELYPSQETILIYDLTNSYFEGSGYKHPGLKFGRSKEKRNDCLLITLGLLIDERGFAKKSQLFDGNIAEPKTLEKIISQLETENLFKKPAVLIDAGIASAENLKYLKTNGYEYICVSREKIKKKKEEEREFILIKENKKNRIEASVYRETEEEKAILVQSKLKSLKEEGMRNKLTERFEKELESMEKGFIKPRGMKKYDKVLEKIGRLKEKHKLVSGYYEIEVESKDQKTAQTIKWKQKSTIKESFSGNYVIKTSMKELNEEKIWNLYNMIRGVEDAFRSLKLELGIRPNYHQLEKRINGHIFMSILAYHLLQIIEYKLKEKNEKISYRNLREKMSSHILMTVSMKVKEKGSLYVRKASKPEVFHEHIYKLLGIDVKTNYIEKKWMQRSSAP